MKHIRRTSQFKKDVRRLQKRGYDLDRLKRVIEKLAHNDPLDAQYADHALQGNFKGLRDCHIKPDWLLIYKNAPDELVLVRTGTHSDLFGR